MQKDYLRLDNMYRLTLLGGEARAFLLESTQMVEQARRIHSLSKTATAALGRTLSVTSIMGAMLKGEKESVTCRIDGKGPGGLIMTVGKSDASVKGFVAHPFEEVPRRGEKLDVGAYVGKEGTLTVIKDLNLREPYVGQTPLVSGEIGEDFALYFTSSEQTPSLVSVGVLVADRVLSAGALVIQMLPGASSAAISSIENSAGMFMDISKSMLADGLDGTLEQLLTHLEPEVLDKIPVRYRCDCSRERMEKALMLLGDKELTELLNERHGAEMHCNFCNTKRVFSEDELSRMIDKLKNSADEQRTS